MGNLQSAEPKSELQNTTDVSATPKPQENQTKFPNPENSNNNNLRSPLKSSTDQLRSSLKRSHDKKQDPSWLTYWVAARTGNCVF